jgi:SAM-dependent methyltransferase
MNEKPSRHFLARQRQYWDVLAANAPDDVLRSHWADANGGPVSLQMFTDIAAYLRTEFLSGRESGTVLELGCGNGLVLREVVKQLGDRWKVWGVDLSPDMLHHSVIPQHRLAVADAANVPAPDGIADLVYLHGVVQYFSGEQYLRQVVDECMRLTKPGGSICYLDMPISWLVDLMSTRVRLRHRLPLPRSVVKLLRRLRSHSQSWQFERIGGRAIRVPSFTGFYADPDFFQEYADRFDSISIQLQPYSSKPIEYRRFRFNAVLKGRR